MAVDQDNKTEMLIEQVKNHPILYDKSDPKYKYDKTELWNDIAEKMEESDINALKMKWKNLRDAYIKYLRCNKSGNMIPKSIRQYKMWPWARNMSFLRPYIRLASVNRPAICKAARPEEKVKASTSNDVYNNVCSVKSDNIDIVLTEVSQTPQSRKRPAEQTVNPQVTTTTTSESSVDKVITYLNNKQKDYDDVDLIFLGYAKTVKKMSKTRQATVKFQIAKIIMESELEESQEPDCLMDVKPFHSPENNSFYFPQ